MISGELVTSGELATVQAPVVQVAREDNAGSELDPTGLPGKPWVLPFIRSKDI